MAAYDTTLFDPPAPLAKVTLRKPGSSDTLSDVPMLLDSGADVTLIPGAFAEELGLSLEPDEAYELMGFDGSRSFAPVVRLEMIFSNKVFRGRFLLIDQEWGIIGRDILNLLSLLLNGPDLTWDEHRKGV